MGRVVEKLSAVGLKSCGPGYHGDGGGLWFQVTSTGSRTWVFRYTSNGRTREMGLGPFPTVTLKGARAKAASCRLQREQGLDPLAERDRAKLKAAADAARVRTFDDCVESYLERHGPKWRNAKHAAQWRATLSAYASPTLGRHPVGAIDLPMVLKCLQPIWNTKPETASRVRGRIEAVLSDAKAQGFRTGENPARWRDGLEHSLPRAGEVKKVVHHAALPWSEITSFMAELAKQKGISALAFQFLIFTAARTGEVRGARWSEIDLINKVWTVPASRMKAKQEHQVPLSVPALGVLGKRFDARIDVRDETEFVFPSVARSRPSIEVDVQGDAEFTTKSVTRVRALSVMALDMLLRRMNPEPEQGLAKWHDQRSKRAITVHGFRSTFRDWIGEKTSFPSDLAEQCLAHRIHNKVEAAYKRGAALERRREIMDKWGAFSTNIE